ncbi:hypothetical protein BELL_0416g00040 [Botrytis elliptica]|uniref:Uncharacterized protein n=1 Tax=Botrytis elliptica TaxID=278938 RepID=A0A4Z1JV90_9HELO|nr:hypothetical protein BELL_0416g00040 [Botrytis elliptica]
MHIEAVFCTICGHVNVAENRTSIPGGLQSPDCKNMARCESGQKAGSYQHVTISQSEICWIKRLDIKDID